MRLLPVVDVHHAIASVDFDDRRDERDDVIADVLDVRRVVDRHAVRELHQRRRRAGLRTMNGAGDVVDGRGLRHERGRGLVVHVERARVAQLREVRLVRVELGDERLARDRDGDVLAPLFGGADRVDLHAIRQRLGEHPHVLVDLFRVRELAGCAGDVAQHCLRRRHAGLGRHVVDERREEEALGGVLLDLLRVLVVDRLLGIAAGTKGGGIGELRTDRLRERGKRRRGERDDQSECGGGTPHDGTSSGCGGDLRWVPAVGAHQRCARCVTGASLRRHPAGRTFAARRDDTQIDHRH